MATTPLVQYMDETTSRRGKLYWGRADLDGAPFRARGGSAPLMTNEEADERQVRVFDHYNRIFDLSQPQQNEAYLEIMGRICNQRAKLIYIERRISTGKKTGRMRVSVYVEWVEDFMEDGQPMQSQRPYIGRPNE